MYFKWRCEHTIVARDWLVRLAMPTIIICRDSEIFLKVLDLFAPLSCCLSPAIEEQQVRISRFTGLREAEADPVFQLGKV